MIDYFYSKEFSIWNGMLSIAGRIWTYDRLMQLVEDLSNEENQ